MKAGLASCSGSSKGNKWCILCYILLPTLNEYISRIFFFLYIFLKSLNHYKNVLLNSRFMLSLKERSLSTPGYPGIQHPPPPRLLREVPTLILSFKNQKTNSLTGNFCSRKLNSTTEQNQKERVCI